MDTHCWIAHAVPGRVRLRLAATGPGPERLLETLRAAPGVARVEHRPASASLLVHYEPGHWSPEELGAVAASAGLAMEAVSPTPWFALFWTGAALLLQWLLPEDRPEPASALVKAPADA